MGKLVAEQGPPTGGLSFWGLMSFANASGGSSVIETGGSGESNVISSAPCIGDQRSPSLLGRLQTLCNRLIQNNIQAGHFLERLRLLVKMTQTQFLRACRSRLIQGLALVSLAVGLPACAAPREPVDPVVRFLRDRGLMESSNQAAESGNRLFDSVRDKASDLVLTAMNFLGVPYRYGGVSEDSGFDCSGFTRHVFERSMGLLLPRRAEDQASSGSLLNINADDLKPGDLVFFNTMRRTFSHVGIYVGEGKFIHAPRTGSAVRVEDMRQAYWTNRFNGARRVPDLSVGVASSQIPSASINQATSSAP